MQLYDGEIPLDAFGTLIKNAILQHQRATGIPLEIIAPAAYAGATVAVQDCVDSQSPGFAPSPITAYAVIMANAVAGKDEGARPFLKPAIEFASFGRELRQSARSDLAADKLEWKIRIKQCTAKLEIALVEGDAEGVQRLKVELSELHRHPPSEAPSPRVLLSNASQFAAIRRLEQWSSILLYSMDGAPLLKKLHSDLDFITPGYGGDTITLNRANVDIEVLEPRISLLLGLQPALAAEHVSRDAGRADASGLNSRIHYSLVPPSPMYLGRAAQIYSRGDRQSVADDGSIQAFQERASICLQEAYLRRLAGQSRRVVPVTGEALNAFDDLRCWTKSLGSLNSFFADFRSHAERILVKAVRMAVATHAFNDVEGPLSGYAIYNAGLYAQWGVSQYLKLRESLSPLAQAERDSWVLRRALQRLMSGPSATVTRRTLFSSCDTQFSTRRFEAAFTHLVNLGAVRCLPGPGVRIDLRATLAQQAFATQI
jgi:hypothetical protein